MSSHRLNFLPHATFQKRVLRCWLLFGLVGFFKIFFSYLKHIHKDVIMKGKTNS